MRSDIKLTEAVNCCILELTRMIFGGRLGEYKYYDMDKVIEAALDVVQKELA